MVALRDKNDSSSIWQYEKRNVYEDLQEHFGTKIAFIDAVAIMTDSDNSVAKEMLYTEFEAVLDHIVGVPDFQGKKHIVGYV